MVVACCGVLPFGLAVMYRLKAASHASLGCPLQFIACCRRLDFYALMLCMVGLFEQCVVVAMRLLVLCKLMAAWFWLTVPNLLKGAIPRRCVDTSSVCIDDSPVWCWNSL
jgi:hypothetical protein